MSAFAGPEMATDGLIFCIDAGDPNCFGPGQTSAYNVVTGGEVTGANGNPGTGPHTPNTANMPAYNSAWGGVFDFTGGRGMNCDEDLGAHTQFSLSMWFNAADTTLDYFVDGRNDGGQWFIKNYTTNQNYEYHQQLSYNYGSPHAASDFPINQWVYMVVVSDATESRLYLNGSEVTGYTAQASVDEDLGVNFRIGTRYTTSSQWVGYMNQINIYDRVLSVDEVKKNFWATKGRYGL